MQGAHCDTQVGRSFKERGEGGPTHGSEPGPCAQPAHQGDMSCMERPKGRQDGCGGRWAAAAGGPREDGCKARAGTPQGGGVRGRSKPWQTGRMPRRGRRKQGQRPRKGGCVPRAGKVRIGKGRQEPGGGGETPAPRGRVCVCVCVCYRGWAWSTGGWLWEQRNETVHCRNETAVEAGCPSGPIVNHHQSWVQCREHIATRRSEEALRSGGKGGQHTAASPAHAPSQPTRGI